MKLLFWLKKLFKKRNDPPFLIAPTRPDIQISDEDILHTDMICPQCQCNWAEATIRLGSYFTPEDFKVRPEFAPRAEIKGGKPIYCPSCKWQYTNNAILALALAAINRQRIQQQTDAKAFKPRRSSDAK